MLETAAEPIASLYVHVPFCAQKCAYCAFYSEPSSGEVINRYVLALIRELEMVAADCKPRTVFFGGGTPSLLNLRQWEQVLGAMERLKLLGASEWTVECNPATVSADKAKLLRSFGVNRISMGVQSLNEALLDRLGRIHTRDMVFKSFDLLRRAGFDNLNLDLMFAIPGQTLEVWRETLREATALGSEHLSSYEVIYEEDTALYAQLHAGEFDADEDLACAMYDEFVESATRADFHQYEVANFARGQQSVVSSQWSVAEACPEVTLSSTLSKTCLFASRDAIDIPALACRHNVNYWRHRLIPAPGQPRPMSTAASQIPTSKYRSGISEIHQPRPVRHRRRQGHDLLVLFRQLDQALAEGRGITFLSRLDHRFLAVQFISAGAVELARDRRRQTQSPCPSASGHEGGSGTGRPAPP